MRGRVIDIADLLAAKPALHERKDSGAVLQTLPDRALFALHDLVCNMSEPRTLETGNGLSTVVFAMSGAEHTSIAPDSSTFARIRSYCEENAVATDRLVAVCDYSQNVLPKLAPDGLDFVLIDGGHGFPTAFVDFAYTANRIRVGGYLMVDDTWLWTGAFLEEFLDADPAWERTDYFPPKTSLFRKVAKSDCFSDWHMQPHIKLLSDEIRETQKQDRIRQVERLARYRSDIAIAKPRVEVRRGQVSMVEVHVTNRSDATWPTEADQGHIEGAVRLGVRWYRRGPAGGRERQADLMLLHDQQRVAFTSALPQGGAADLSLQIDARSGPIAEVGHYLARISLVHEAICWFDKQGDASVDLDVVVS